MEFNRLFRRDRAALLVLLIVTALYSGVIAAYHIFLTSGSSDYSGHIQFARDLLVGKVFRIHALFQVLVIGLAALLPAQNFEGAAWLVTVAAYCATTVLLYSLLRAVPVRRRTALVAALCLIVVTPITILTWSNSSLYFGYIGINVLHNPTMVLLKPFALLIVLYTLRVLEGKQAFSPQTIALGVVLAALSLFAKPSFAFAYLPALIAVGAYRLSRRQLTGLPLLLGGLIAPLAVLLAAQFLLQYVALPDNDSSIVFAPLAALLQVEPSIGWLGIKAIMSAAFPLSVTLLYWRDIRHDLAAALSWLTFLCGAAQMALFSETGERAAHGNFWWSAQIGLFLLFVFTTRFWIGRVRREPRAYLTLALFALHVVSCLVLILVTVSYGTEAAW